MIIVRLRVERWEWDEANSVHLHTEGALLLLQEIAASHPALFLSSFRETGIAHGRELSLLLGERSECDPTRMSLVIVFPSLDVGVGWRAIKMGSPLLGSVLLPEEK